MFVDTSVPGQGGGRTGLSQTFPDQCARYMRGRYNPTFGYGLGLRTAEFLSIVAPIQVRQSATRIQIVRGKTLRQALFERAPRVSKFLADRVKTRLSAFSAATRRRPRSRFDWQKEHSSSSSNGGDHGSDAEDVENAAEIVGKRGHTEFSTESRADRGLVARCRDRCSSTSSA